MTEITHQASRSEKEHELIMRECERATSLGGSFKIENKYTDNFHYDLLPGGQAMKFCKDCKHSHRSMYVPFDTCSRSVRVIKIDLRTGDEIIGGWRSTRYERKPGRIIARLTGMCGKEGRFWEAKA